LFAPTSLYCGNNLPEKLSTGRIPLAPVASIVETVPILWKGSFLAPSATILLSFRHISLNLASSSYLKLNFSSGFSITTALRPLLPINAPRPPRAAARLGWPELNSETCIEALL